MLTLTIKLTKNIKIHLFSVEEETEMGGPGKGTGNGRPWKRRTGNGRGNHIGLLCRVVLFVLSSCYIGFVIYVLVLRLLTDQHVAPFHIT